MVELSLKFWFAKKILIELESMKKGEKKIAHLPRMSCCTYRYKEMKDDANG